MNKSVRHGFGLAFTPFMLLYIESWLPLLASALIAAAICGAASFMMERVDFQYALVPWHSSSNRHVRAQSLVGLAMPHKFKIGTIVNYYPKDRMLSTARGTYTITKLMPAIAGKLPEYRIKHFSEEFERVAFENEL